MNVSPSKANILKRIRSALSQSVPIPYPHAEGDHSVFRKMEDNPEVTFAENFLKQKGRFVFCADQDELAIKLISLGKNEQWKTCFCCEPAVARHLQSHDLPFTLKEVTFKEADAGMTGCEALVARTGSVMLSAKQPLGRKAGISPPVHIVIGYMRQLVGDIKEAFDLLQKKYGSDIPSMISLHSGPSRTSDIEKTSVLGVHGPLELYVFLVDER